VLLTEARECIEGIDELLARPALSQEAFSGYVALNGRFHALLAEMAGSAVVARQLERACRLPFASPNGFVMARSEGPRARDTLIVAQSQHRAVLQAIVAREGARAEALMREHARIAHQNLREVLQSQPALRKLPGASLIRRRSTR
jgi:GntR family transcriptional regulator of vanillate catabolism